MVKKVTLITDLVMESVPYYGQDDLRTMRMPQLDICPSGDGGALAMAEAETSIVPIIRLSKMAFGDRTDTYIAYSPDVEEKLGVPINTIYKQMKSDSEELNRQRIFSADLGAKLLAIGEASFWQRVKFVFTGKVPVRELEDGA